ncbi:hypothetical protein ABW19_dt0200056 [Dactylella cylindrospora]|nr:hypothetical protein ABW19_dt0200056 [Dactylella cylindrospora]
MAFNSEYFNATIAWDSVFCYIGDDETGGFLGTSASNEPYLWVFMVKIDGEMFHQNGNYLEPPGGDWDAVTGPPVFIFPPGNHGNLQASVSSGGTIDVPKPIGSHDFTLQPIPISVAGQTVTSLPGVIISAAVLLEENLYPSDDEIVSAHESVKKVVRTTVFNTIKSLGLAGLAADILIEAGIDPNASTDANTAAITRAASTILQRRLKPVADIFEFAATGSAFTTLLNNIGISITGAFDHDDVLGSHVGFYTQTDLAKTYTNRYGNNTPGIMAINATLWNTPKWAFNLHGRVYAHRKFVTRTKPLPQQQRLEVTTTWKVRRADGPHIVAISGVEEGGWMLFRENAADLIRKGQKSFFVKSKSVPGIEVNLLAMKGGFQPHTGKPWYFVITQGDGLPDNNLVNLPDMPYELMPSQAVEWY